MKTNAIFYHTYFLVFHIFQKDFKRVLWIKEEIIFPMSEGVSCGVAKWLSHMSTAQGWL